MYSSKRTGSVDFNMINGTLVGYKRDRTAFGDDSYTDTIGSVIHCRLQVVHW
jgi:hypothetical protein